MKDLVPSLKIQKKRKHPELNEEEEKVFVESQRLNEQIDENQKVTSDLKYQIKI